MPFLWAVGCLNGHVAFQQVVDGGAGGDGGGQKTVNIYSLVVFFFFKNTWAAVPARCPMLSVCIRANDQI